MNQTQKRALTVSVIIAIVFGFYFLKDYFLLVALAAILAFLYNPAYKWFLRKTNNRQGLSVTLTMLFSAFTIIIPIVLLLFITIEQTAQLVDNIKNASIDSDSIKSFINNSFDTANRTVNNVMGEGTINLTLDSATSWFKENVSSIVKSVVNYLAGIAGGISSLITKSIIFIFVFISLLKNQDVLLKSIKKLNPLGTQLSELYLEKISLMTKAMVKGQFIIAFLQGLTDAALLWIVGFDYFFFWLVLLTFLSIIPLGGGIIVLPIGVVMVLTGHVWQGLVLILGHILIVTNIDNILRPKLVPKSARLDSALTLLSVFAGLGMFGFLGIVIGPVIMIVIVTTIQIYLEYLSNNKNKSGLGKFFNK